MIGRLVTHVYLALGLAIFAAALDMYNGLDWETRRIGTVQMIVSAYGIVVGIICLIGGRLRPSQEWCISISLVFLAVLLVSVPMLGRIVRN